MPMPKPISMSSSMTPVATPLRRLPSFRALALAVASVLAVAAPAEAASIVDRTVASPSLAGANSVDAADWVAQSFVLTAATTIGSIAVQVADASPGTDAGQAFLLAVYADSAGLPGLNFNADDQGRLDAVNVVYSADGWNLASGLQWQLAPGTYWLAVEAGSDAGAVTSLVLPTGAQPAPQGVAFYSGASAYAPTVSGDAFGLRIDSAAAVAAVPEPGSWMLTLAGLSCLAALKRRRAAPRA